MVRKMLSVVMASVLALTMCLPQAVAFAGQNDSSHGSAADRMLASNKNLALSQNAALSQNPVVSQNAASSQSSALSQDIASSQTSASQRTPLLSRTTANDTTEVVAWDGQTQTQPALEDDVYQIGTGAELAWFAAQVNEGTATSSKAVLTNDINLNDQDWTPIGNSTSNKFAGSFDGQGHRIEKLLCKVTSWAPAGLFGIIDAATIQNVVVEGSVSAADFYAAGGLVARMEGSSVIQNCGNLATVKNESNSGRAAGIVGWSYGTGTVRACFNRGAIEGKAKTAGIVADCEYGTTVTNCYNAGVITGHTCYGIAYATTISSSYNTGKISGTSKSYAVYPGSNCTAVFVLEGTASDSEETEGSLSILTATDMQKPSFVATLGESWQVDVGAAVNRGYPLLKWEQAGSTEPVKLGKPSGLSWLLPDPPTADDAYYDIAYEMMQAAWQPVIGASAYTVRLYRSDDLTTPVYVSADVEDENLDLYPAFAELAKKSDASYARYVFTVQAKGEGDLYVDGDESQPVTEVFEFDPAAFVSPTSQTTWNEASKIALFGRVEGADFYLVDLFRGSTKVTSLELDRAAVGEVGSTISVRFLTSMTGTGDYYFTVRAGRDVASGPNAGKRAVSALVISATTRYEAAQGETVEIASADDWMRIVNLTKEGTQYASDADAQNVEWAKNYVITADLDFSNLSAEQLQQTKSWGNVDAYFQGTLDGQGHSITGLTLSNGDCGLFSYIGTHGVVRNLTVDAANVLFSDNAGIFCLYNYGTISCCAVKNTNISSDFGAVLGGFLSRNFGLVEDCYVAGGTLATSTRDANAHGGFVGNNSGLIRRCWSSMDVSTQSYCAGGFVGWVDERINAETGESLGGRFENCFALGDVSAARGWSGGFVGRVNSSRATFSSCYAANTVSSAENPDHAYGFFGSMGGEGARALNGATASSFYIMLPAENCVNCYYCTDLTDKDNEAALATGMTRIAMQDDAFTATLGLDWQRDDAINNGLPVLSGMAAPEAPQTQQITVQLVLAHYDRSTYTFVREGSVMDVTFATEGNPRVVDVMQAAADLDLIEYRYTVSSAYGGFVEAINGYELSNPDGWMFTVNDHLSPVGMQLASVEDGDRLLWYEGTPANLFTGPTWREMTGDAPAALWKDIATPEDLRALSEGSADVSANYRLTADIDLAGESFKGIGSPEKPFTGMFSGQGHSISGLSIDSPTQSNVGLFRVIRGAEIRNLELKDAHVTGLRTVGTLVGRADIVLDADNRENCIGNLIGGCDVSGTVVATNEDISATSDGSYAGGLIGFNDGDSDSKTNVSVYSAIDGCSAKVNVQAKSLYAGGLVGGNYGYITNCVASGSVKGAICTGGFFGGNVGAVYDSGATGAVTGGSRTGGFGGDNYNDAIERCYSTGTVVASGERIGGFVGDAGGTLRQCSSAGAVQAGSASEYVGSFAGYYTGSLTGLYVRITFVDNCGWSGKAQDAQESQGAQDAQDTQSTIVLPAIGNMKSSVNEAEQAVLDASAVTDWSALRTRFADLYDVALSVDPPAPGDYTDPDDPDPHPDDPDPSKLTAAEVAALIDAIGVVALEEDGTLPATTKAAIDAARAAYDALSNDQRALVTNAWALQAAEQLYAYLEKQVEERDAGKDTGKDSGKGGSNASRTEDRDINAITPADSVAQTANVSATLKQPLAKKFTVTIKPKKKSLSVTFPRISGAQNYLISYKKAGATSWSYAWTAGKTSYTIGKVAAGGMYDVRIAAYAKIDGSWMRSAWSDCVYSWIRGGKAKLAPGKKQVKVTVTKVAHANGYTVSWAYKKSLTKAKIRTMKGAKSKPVLIKKLKSGKKVFVRVAPYRVYKGHIYSGAASAAKGVKVR